MLSSILWSRGIAWLFGLLLIAIMAGCSAPAYAASGFLPAELSGVLVELAGTVLAALSGAVLMLLRKKLKLAVDDGHRSALLPALQAGLDYALEAPALRHADLRDPIKRANLVEEATSYVFRRVPDAAAHFKLDRPAMAELLRARLPLLDSVAGGAVVSPGWASAGQTAGLHPRDLLGVGVSTAANSAATSAQNFAQVAMDARETAGRALDEATSARVEAVMATNRATSALVAAESVRRPPASGVAGTNAASDQMPLSSVHEG